MISYEDEIGLARNRGLLSSASAAEAAALERRDIFSIFFELRLASYVAVALITTAVGILIKENLNRIGPLAIVSMLMAFAALCYASAVRKLRRNEPRSIVGDYILLLGALLLSAAVGVAEAEWHLLGTRWREGLLVVVLLHAIGAYLFGSRLVLTASITALIGWFGASTSVDHLFSSDHTFGWKCLAAAVALGIWRILNTLGRRQPDFNAVFDQFAVNLGLLGALIVVAGDQNRWTGAAILACVVAVALWRGMAKRQESFILYAVVYGLIGFDILVFHVVSKVTDSGVGFLWVLITTPLAIFALFRIHFRMRKER